MLSNFVIKFFEIFNEYIIWFTSIVVNIKLFEDQKIY